MTDGQLERKFASLADPVVGPAQASVIVRAIDQLEGAASVEPLGAALRPGAGPSSAEVRA